MKMCTHVPMILHQDENRGGHIMYNDKCENVQDMCRYILYQVSGRDQIGSVYVCVFVCVLV